VATHRIAHHFPQLLDGFSLGGDGMTGCNGDIPATHLVLAHFKDYFAHAGTLEESGGGEIRIVDRKERKKTRRGNRLPHGLVKGVCLSLPGAGDHRKTKLVSERCPSEKFFIVRKVACLPIVVAECPSSTRARGVRSR
jgi:hypothetical protein